MSATIEQLSGVWEAGRDENVYRSDSLNSVSNSEKECFRKSPEKYYGIYVDKSIPAERSVALDIGGGLHEQVLLPNGDSRIVEIPPDCLKSNGDRNTAGAAYKAFAAANQGMYLLKREDIELVERLRDRVMSHPIASGFLRDAQYEVPVKVQCPDSALWLRCRYDCLTVAGNGQPLNADIKTYGGDLGDRKALVGHVMRFGYDRQLAMYRTIHRLAFGEDCRGVLIFLEKKPPHRVQVIDIPPDWLAVATSENRETLLAMAKARETCDFSTPGINDVLTLQRPRWADFSREYEVE